MQEPDVELEGWRRQWQAQEVVSADLIKKVESGTRQIRRGVLGEVAVTVLMGSGSLGWALVSGRAEIAVLAVAIWIFIAIAWVVSLLLRRGTWAPASTTTAAFLDLSILRCERALQAITLQAVLYVVILVFDLVWLYDYRGETSVREFLLRPMVLLFLLVVTPGAGAAAWWFRGRLQRELRNLVALRRSSP